MLSLLLVVLAAPAKGGAAAPSSSLPNRASLFVVAKETGETSAAKAEVELRKALEERSVSLADLESLFPVDLPPNKGAALVKEGTDAVDNLDFDAANAKFTEAMAFYSQNPALAEAREVATVHLHLANIALQTGGKPGQKAALEKRLAREHRDVYVASCGTMEKDGELSTWTSWAEGVVALLPRTEIVGFAPGDGEMLFVAWDDVVAVAGGRLQAQAESPPRFLVESFPDATEWQALALRAVHPAS